MKLEADEFCTAMTESPPGTPERFAFVMGHAEADTRLYFFVSREMVHEIVQSMIEMVGYDA
jgi:hypothetical protein